MWEIDPEKLRSAMEEARLNQSELAEAVGIKQPSIGRLLSGETKSTRKIGDLAKALGVPFHQLIRKTSADQTDLALVEEGDPESDTVEIDNIDLAFGLGSTFLDSDFIEVEKIAFSRTWLRQFTNALPHHLFSTRGLGNSMEPTINDRDVVIVDKSITRLDQSAGEKYWAVSFGGAGMIKRLRPMPDGTVKLLSDNQLVSPEVASDGELFIIGRVCAIVRSV